MGEPSKQSLPSRRTWANILSLSLVLIGAAIGHEWVAENPQVIAVLLGVQSLLNLAAQLIPKQPINVVGGKE